MFLVLVKHKILQAAKIQNYFGDCNGNLIFFVIFERFMDLRDSKDLRDLKI